MQAHFYRKLKRSSGNAARAILFMIGISVFQPTSGSAQANPQAGSRVAPNTRPDDLYTQFMLPAASFTNVTSKGKTKMFEFSGVAAIGNKLIVVDNETGKLGHNSAGIQDQFNEALFEVTCSPVGELKLKRGWSQAFANAPAFDDLEGITGSGNFVYMMGSHSTDKEGAHRPERHLFLRLALGPDGEPPPGTQVELFDGLTEVLLAWGRSAGLKTDEIRAKGGKKKGTTTTFLKNFDIEGLASVPGERGLLLGLRGPLHTRKPDGKKRAFVLHFENPDEVFAQRGAPPGISTFATLDLKGQGISSLEYDPLTKSLLIATTDKDERGPIISRLWQWRLPLKENDPVEVQTFTGKKLEGVARIPPGSKFEHALLLAFDEESKEAEDKQFGRLEVFHWKP